MQLFSRYCFISYVFVSYICILYFFYVQVEEEHCSSIIEVHCSSYLILFSYSWLIHTFSFEGVDPLEYEKKIRLDQFVVRKALRFIVVPLESSTGTYCTPVFL